MVTPPLPWRDSGKTVCGQPISQYADGRVVGLADAHAMLRRLGQPASPARARDARAAAEAAALWPTLPSTQRARCAEPIARSYADEHNETHGEDE